jgi:hypothetical protein
MMWYQTSVVAMCPEVLMWLTEIYGMCDVDLGKCDPGGRRRSA